MILRFRQISLLSMPQWRQQEPRNTAEVFRSCRRSQKSCTKVCTGCQETSNLIKNSITKAENGAKIAEETAVELNKIVEDITRVAELVKA